MKELIIGDKIGVCGYDGGMHVPSRIVPPKDPKQKRTFTKLDLIWKYVLRCKMSSCKVCVKQTEKYARICKICKLNNFYSNQPNFDNCNWWGQKSKRQLLLDDVKDPHNTHSRGALKIYELILKKI